MTNNKLSRTGDIVHKERSFNMKPLEQRAAIHGREFREGAGCLVPDNTEANFRGKLRLRTERSVR